ncbi:MAG: ABC transporter substrate-binding protein [Myxococcales bacterium]
MLSPGPFAALLALCLAILLPCRPAGAREAAPERAPPGGPLRQHLGPPVPREAARVVSLAPSLTEMVLALDDGNPARLVGVTRFDDDPRVAGLRRVGGYNDPAPELVLALKPDVVLAQPAPANRGPVEALARLGIPVEAWPLQTVGQIEDALRDLGALLGRAARAEGLVREIEAARSRARARAARMPHPRVLLVFGLEPLVVGGRTGFAGELLSDAGADNVATTADKPFFRLSEEAAVAARPEVIVLCGVDPPQGRLPIRGLAGARVATLRSTALLHPGPRIPEALADLQAVLERPATQR